MAYGSTPGGVFGTGWKVDPCSTGQGSYTALLSRRGIEPGDFRRYADGCIFEQPASAAALSSARNLTQLGRQRAAPREFC